jgi:hypothetical protein
MYETSMRENLRPLGVDKTTPAVINAYERTGRHKDHRLIQNNAGQWA